MNHKTWLIVFGVFALALIGGTGFYAFSGYANYSDKIAGWDSNVGTIESLERRVPYPNKENAEALKEEVVKYNSAVQELYQSLNSFQRPLNTALQGTQFAQLVKKTVQDYREFAKVGGLEIESAEEFQLGFDAYAASIPAPQLVPVLDYELEAIDHLLKGLVTSRVGSLLSFERDAIPGEPGGAEEHDSGVVHKYPVRLRFRSDYNALQTFVNSIANDKQFFYVVRVLKVQNGAIEGPMKTTGESALGQGYVYGDTGEPVALEDLELLGLGIDSDEEVAEAARAAGYLPSQQDARVLMGQEELEAYMVVDIVRFVNPEEASIVGEADAEDKKR
jgi:hypothetical protein